MLLIIAGIGFILLWIYIQYTHMHIKKADKVEATVIFSNHMIDQNKKGQMIKNIYYTMIEFEYHGKKIRKHIDEAFQEGDTLIGYYDAKKDEFMTEETLKLHHSKGTHLILIFGIFMLLFGLLLYFVQFNFILSEAFLDEVLPYFIALGFILCGGYMTYKDKPKKAPTHWITLEATVISIKEEWIDKGYLYFPSYVYTYDEEESIFHSKHGRNPIRLKEGDKVELYYDPNDDSIHEKGDTPTAYKTGLFFVAFGIVLSFIYLIF